MEIYTYDNNRKSLTFFLNDKPIGGMIGKIAEKKHKELTGVGRTIKALVNGRKRK